MGASDAQTDAELLKKISKLERINLALMSRVERSVDAQAGAFGLFETAIALDQQVRARTTELRRTMEVLEHSNVDLVRLKNDAEQANRAKTSFVTAVSHDLLQPLDAARLTLSAISDTEMSARGAELVHQAERALVSLEDLLRTLLDLSKLEAGVLKPHFEPVDLAQLLDSVREESEPVAQRKKLDLRFRPNSLHVLADRTMLRRIVQNLVSNAIRYTRNGGILVAARRRNGFVAIDVYDTGSGIPDDERERIFDEFQRINRGAAELDSGFGLGLSIVRRFCAAMKAKVALRSRLDRGSMFRVILPEAQVQSCAALASKQPFVSSQTYGVSGAHVLIIENDDTVAEAMQSLLERWGCSVDRVASMSDALTRIVDTARIDLMIADLHLDHGVRGTDVVSAIFSTLGRRMPALVITADYSADAEQEVKALGLELLKKPVRPAELRSLMSHLLA